MTDHKFTDEEVIKAIETCAKAECWGDCEDLGCPAATSQGCRFYLRTDEDYEGVIQDEMLKDALDLINRQKAEIEELEAECDRQYEQAEADIRANMADGGTSCHWCIDGHRAEAIKEFAERLKEMPIKCGFHLFGLRTKEEVEEYFNGILFQVKDAIDSLVKEMTEDKNENT